MGLALVSLRGLTLVSFTEFVHGRTELFFSRPAELRSRGFKLERLGHSLSRTFVSLLSKYYENDVHLCRVPAQTPVYVVRVVY